MKKPASPADPSRREFMRHACCAAVGGTGILSSLAQLRTMAAVAGDSLPSRPATAGAVNSDYKALVCVFLIGGNDAGSMIVPTDTASYSKYAADRGDVAVPSSAVLPISPRRYSDGRNYGFNQAASGLHSLFTQNRLAVLGNVGTLLRSTSLADYRAGQGLPPQLFSHLDQLTQWQSSVPDKPFETGWGGRLADLLDAFNTNNQISMSITLAGANFFQRGNRIQSYSVGGGGANLMQFSNQAANTNGVSALRARGLRGILAGTPPMPSPPLSAPVCSRRWTTASCFLGYCRLLQP